METGTKAAVNGDYSENGSVGVAGEEKQRLEASTESSGLESTTENKENGDLKLESSKPSTPIEAKPAGEEKQRLEASTESSGLESTTEIKENGDLKFESSLTSTPVEAKQKPMKSLPMLDSLYPNGQSRYKLIREWSNGRLRIFSVPVPVVERRRPEWKRVLRCRRENGKIKISWMEGQESDNIYRPLNAPTDQRR